MMVGDNFIYIFFPKCAGTFISEVISRYGFGKELNKLPEGVKFKGHSTKLLNPDKIPDNYRNKIITTSIRNPWEWYVSFWAYKHYVKTIGIDEKINNPGHINYYYNPKLNFKDYLLKIFDNNRNTDFIDRKINICNHSNPFNYMVKQNVGLYTFFWHEKSMNMIDKYFRVENIWQELSDFFKIPIRNLKKTNKINVSPHDHYSTYYDDELKNMVAKKDRIIIDKFDYKFEEA